MSNRSDDGFVTVTHVAAVALSLLLFTMFANLIVVQLQRATLRAAADQGVRAGSRSQSDLDADGACERAATSALDDLLGIDSVIRRQFFASCTTRSGRVDAFVSGRSPAWLPISPDFRLDERAFAVREAE